MQSHLSFFVCRTLINDLSSISTFRIKIRCIYVFDKSKIYVIAQKYPSRNDVNNDIEIVQNTSNETTMLN